MLAPQAGAQPCNQDYPTAASLRAARAAVLGGANNVSLSPGGCLRYERWTTQLLLSNITVVTREEVRFNSQPVLVWEHNYHPLFPIQSQFSSTGTRDGDLDGFQEWRASVTRIFPPPTTAPSGPVVINPPTVPQPYPIGIDLEVAEYDPSSQALVRRETSSFPGDGTMHVTVEEGPGTLHVTSSYDGPSKEQASAQSSSELERNIVDIVCPAGLANQVMDVLLDAASNGGKCLRDSFRYADAAAMAHAVATRNFLIACQSGTDPQGGGAAAGVEPASAADPTRPIILLINTTWWSLNNRRERTLFHELMHVIGNKHDHNLESLLASDERRWSEVDRTEACESLCYNQNPTKCECARCRDTMVCGSCNNYASCYSNQLGGFCPCPNPGRWFEAATQCITDCPSGLGCFGVQCKPETNACK
jgi:hypothetical protein